MKKLSDKESIKYWQDIHRNTKLDLKAVCFPNKSVWFNLLFDKIEKYAIKKSLKYLDIPFSNKNLLDIGSGRGRWLEFYSIFDANVTGLDLSLDAVNFCHQKGYDTIAGNIEKLSFQNNTFDIINSVTTLQHLSYKKQKRAVNEIQRVLKNQGYVILLENTWNDPSPHVWGRSVNEWRSLFNKCTLIFCENHYYIYPLKIFWKIPIIDSNKFIEKILENMIITITYPLEFSLMKINFKKLNKGGLQHLMIFQKIVEK